MIFKFNKDEIIKEISETTEEREQTMEEQKETTAEKTTTEKPQAPFLKKQPSENGVITVKIADIAIFKIKPDNYYKTITAIKNTMRHYNEQNFTIETSCDCIFCKQIAEYVREEISS